MTDPSFSSRQLQPSPAGASRSSQLSAAAAADAHSRQGDSGDVDVEAWVRRIQDADPDVLGLLQDTWYLLERLVPVVEAELSKIHPLSAQFEGAFAKAARAAGFDPADAIREQVAKATGVDGLYDLADRLAKAHPDNCDCRVHGCAKLIGILAGGEVFRMPRGRGD